MGNPGLHSGRSRPVPPAPRSLPANSVTLRGRSEDGRSGSNHAAQAASPGRRAVPSQVQEARLQAPI